MQKSATFPLSILSAGGDQFDEQGSYARVIGATGATWKHWADVLCWRDTHESSISLT